MSLCSSFAGFGPLQSDRYWFRMSISIGPCMLIDGFPYVKFQPVRWLESHRRLPQAHWQRAAHSNRRPVQTFNFTLRHRQQLPGKEWAQAMLLGAALQTHWANPKASETPSGKLMGLSETLGSGNCKCNGPILGHQRWLSPK